MKRLIVLCSIFLCFQVQGQKSGVDSGLSKFTPFIQSLQSFTNNIPQEKFHLHTDRDFYVPGEKIWFKAYVVDARSHLHPTYSRYVYVELISPADTLIERVMIRQTDGMFHGHLLISNIVQDGNYTLRAYTRYMENQGDDYFFKKNIRIGNLSSTQSQQLQTVQTEQSERSSGRNRSRRATPTEQDDFDISFFPEGGNLLDGVLCKVAFKAINRSGYPETVFGEIVDENGAEIDFMEMETRYAGMGVFVYRPETGKRIFLKFHNENGLEKLFELPQPDAHARSLTASMQGDRLHIGVQKSVHASDISCYLLVHCRGDVLYFAEWDKAQGFATFSKERFPAGVIQIVLFDGQMNPLSERLVFSKNDDTSAKVDFQTDKIVYEKRDKVVVTLTTHSLLVRDGEGLGHFSVAITDDKDITVDESTTILSTLLLSSELRGYIESPAYYLQDDDAMDLLMMTHGWRRYNIPEIVKGKQEYPQIPFQMDQKLSGHVKTLVNGKPVPDGEILIMMYSDGDAHIGVTSTDRNGAFIVPNLVYPDSSKFYIRAKNRRGRENNVELFVDHDLFPGLVYAPQSPLPVIPDTVAETGDDSAGVGTFMEKAEQRAKFDEDIWSLSLDEVKITAQSLKKPEPRDVFWLNSSSDRTITRKTIEDFYSTSMDIVHFFKMLNPMMEYYEDENGFIHFYIPSGALIGTYPTVRVFIDGMDVTDFFEKSTILVDEIESIDIIRHGPSATVLGLHGSGGGISITTRRGEPYIPPEKFNHVVYTPLGYQKPVEFYSPIYETLEAKRSVIPDYRTTIFWKPDVVISEEGEASFEFYTSDFRTTYSVVIEGITDDGKMVRQVEKIKVE